MFDKVNVRGKNSAHLFVRHAVPQVLQVSADVVHVGVAEEDPGKVFLADGGHAFGVGEELYLEHLCLQVVHEPGRATQTGRLLIRTRSSRTEEDLT